MYCREKYYQVQKCANAFFIIAWFLMLINTCFFYSDMQKWCPPFLGEIALICFIIKAILTFEWSWKEFFLYAALLGMGLLTYLFSSEKRILWLAIVLVAAKGVKVDNIIPLTAYTYLCMCIIFVICFAVGISEQGTNMKGGVSFGLNHPNVCQNYFMLISCLFIYIYYGKVKVWHLAVALILNWVLYFYTLSRSGALTFTAVLLYISIIKLIKDQSKKKLFNRIFLVLVFAGAFVMTWLPILYKNNAFFEMINQFSTGRISQANVYYKSFGLNPFGEYLDVLYEEKPKWFLDIGYTKILINNGIVPYVFVMLNYIVLGINYFINNQYRKILLIIMALISMYFENMCTYIFMNITLVWFAEDVLFNKVLFNKAKKLIRQRRVKGAR